MTYIQLVIGVGFTVFSMIPTLLFGSEKRYERGPNEKVPSFVNTFTSIYDAFKSMPMALLKVVLLFLLSWYGCVINATITINIFYFLELTRL